MPITVTASKPKGTLLAAENDGDATNHHTLANSGKTKLYVRNSGAGARVVTIAITKQVQGQAVTAITKSVPAGETWVFGPFPVSDFGALVNVDVAHAELKLRGVE